MSYKKVSDVYKRQEEEGNRRNKKEITTKFDEEPFSNFIVGKIRGNSGLRKRIF